MARLLLFAPCERAIVEQEANTFSLISILQELTVSPKGIIPDKETVPTARPFFSVLRWYCVALWMQEPGDRTKRFTQQVIVKDPHGKKLMESLAEFEMSKPFHRIIIEVQGFPIPFEGQYSLNIAIRETSQKNWTPAGFFPLLVHHQPALESHRT